MLSTKRSKRKMKELYREIFHFDFYVIEFDTSPEYTSHTHTHVCVGGALLYCVLLPEHPVSVDL